MWRQALAVDGILIVCTVSHPYMPFLNNWLISLAKYNRHQAVLIIAEDYTTLDFVNSRWPGHSVLIPPASSETTSLRFGSQVSRYVCANSNKEKFKHSNDILVTAAYL